MNKKTSLAGKIVLVIIGVYLLIPFLVTLVYSFFVEWTNLLPSGFTVRNYSELFADMDFWMSIGRTLILCAVSVILTIILLLLAMYPVTVMNRKLGNLMQMICMIPYALQGVILSISIISIYTGTGTILSNRMLMLLGAYSILVLPYIYQGIRNHRRQNADSGSRSAGLRTLPCLCAGGAAKHFLRHFGIEPIGREHRLR